jgi:hypothetical protein
MQARRTEAETFRAAPSGRRIPAAEGYTSSSSNPVVLLLRRLGPGGPRAVAVAMLGHTDLGMLICRCEYIAVSNVARPPKLASYAIRSIMSASRY